VLGVIVKPPDDPPLTVRLTVKAAVAPSEAVKVIVAL
jgi:hypothetical protein